MTLLRHPDEVRTFHRGRVEIVRRDSPAFGRVTVEPGWRRSGRHDADGVRHAGYVQAGRLAVESATGESGVAGPGDAVVIEGPDDAWTVGAEPCVFFDLTGAEHWR